MDSETKSAEIDPHTEKLLQTFADLRRQNDDLRDRLRQIRRAILAAGYIIYNYQQDIITVADSEEEARDEMYNLYTEDSDQNLFMMPCTHRLMKNHTDWLWSVNGDGLADIDEKEARRSAAENGDDPDALWAELSE